MTFRTMHQASAVVAACVRPRCRAWTLITALCLLGCGTSDYEALVRARAQELKNRGAVGQLTWNTLTFTSGHRLKWPGEPAVRSEAADGITLEKADVTAGPLAFSANLMIGPAVDIQNVAQLQGQQMQQQGWFQANQVEGNQGGMAYVQLEFTNNDQTQRTLARIYQVDAGKACILSVTGEKVDDPQIVEFLDSLRPG